MDVSQKYEQTFGPSLWYSVTYTIILWYGASRWRRVKCRQIEFRNNRKCFPTYFHDDSSRARISTRAANVLLLFLSNENGIVRVFAKRPKCFPANSISATIKVSRVQTGIVIDWKTLFRGWTGVVMELGMSAYYLRDFVVVRKKKTY